MLTEMQNVAKHLQNLEPTISRIFAESGALGASIGVIHQNKIVNTAGYGYCDISKHVVPNENTSNNLCFLSKSFTAAAIEIFVDKGRIGRDQLFTKVLLSFDHDDQTVRENTSVLDFLLHRTGQAPKDSLWVQDGNELLLKRKDLMLTVSYLDHVRTID